MLLILTDFAEERRRLAGFTQDQVAQDCRRKKSGLVAVTLNLRFQPRLPGSVVGEASMRPGWRTDKIT